jgi:hypothetical protein
MKASTISEMSIPSRTHGFPAAICPSALSSEQPIHLMVGLVASNQSPHLAPASAMLERVRRRDAKYVSTNGALLIRARLVGV